MRFFAREMGLSARAADGGSQLAAVALALLTVAACSRGIDAGAGTGSGADVQAVDNDAAATDTANGGTDAAAPDTQAAVDTDTAGGTDAVASDDAVTKDVATTDATSPDAADVPVTTGCSSDGDCTVSGEVCIAGKCQAPVCAANALVCDASTPGSVLKCDADGKGSTVGGSCQAGTVCGPFGGPHPCDGLCGQMASSGCFCDAACVNNGDCCGVVASAPDFNAPLYDCAGSTCGQCNNGVTTTVACYSKICTANQLTCDGNKVVVCNATGTDYVGSPLDCGTKICVAGACNTCMPSAVTCDGQTLKTCAADGQSIAAATACGATEFCSDTGDGKASCKAQVCTPNQKSCAANQAQTCNSVGSGYSAGPAECTGGKCVSGGCKAFVCTPSAVICSGQSIQTCADDGLAVAASLPCAATEYCAATGGVAACKAQICTPNATTCDGNQVQTCDSVGSAYSAGPTECTGGKCVAGACKPFVCQAAAITCAGQKLQVCAADGLSVLVSLPCAATEYCNDSGDGLASCLPQVCTPTAAYCDGTKASVCDAFGSAAMPNAVDCTATGLDCIAGQCQKCGNAVVEGSETCDDGNTQDGDGCSSTCALSTAGLAVGVTFGPGAVGTVAPNAALKLSTLTIAAWIRPTALPTGGASAGLVVKGSKSSGEFAFCVGSGGSLVLSKYGTADLATSATGLIVADVWQHVAVTHNATQSQLFLNGKLVATGTSGFNLADTSLTIGSGPDGTDPFAGTLADVAIYSSVLADTAIASLAAGKPLGSVGASVGCWPMSEGSGATVFDASGYGLSVSLSGATWSTDFSGAVPGSPTYQLCTPTAPTCFGTFAGVCNDSGTGLASATNCGSIATNCNTGTCQPSYPSCKAALVANPLATDGTFAIDPDGAGPIGASNLYCDMTNGGWTLVSRGGACGSMTKSTTVDGSTPCVYVDPGLMLWLASLSAQVKLTSGPSFGNWTGTANGTNSKAIEALQAGGSWHNGATFDGGWDWTVTCATSYATGWPNMYHACGTPGGVHWVDAISTQGVFQVRHWNAPESSGTWVK